MCSWSPAVNPGKQSPDNPYPQGSRQAAEWENHHKEAEKHPEAYANLPDPTSYTSQRAAAANRASAAATKKPKALGIANATSPLGSFALAELLSIGANKLKHNGPWSPDLASLPSIGSSAEKEKPVKSTGFLLSGLPSIGGKR